MILSILTYQMEAQCVLHVSFVDGDPLLNITSKSIMMAALCSGSMASLLCFYSCVYWRFVCAV